MTSLRRIFNPSLVLLFTIITASFGTSCNNPNSDNTNASNTTAQSNSNTEKDNLPKDDVSELLERVRLPEVPDEVVWREEPMGKQNSRAPGPTDQKITAVLKYNAETSAKLLAQLEKNKKNGQVEIDAESWFPEELIAQTQVSGNESLKGTEYGAQDFYNMPYGSGRIIKIEGTNYFVLELITT